MPKEKQKGKDIPGMPAGTPPTLACLWKTAEEDMFGSEEAVDKALEFGV